jgi:DNA-binding LacI/PurR family transcriptional regulator
MVKRSTDRAGASTQIRLSARSTEPLYVQVKTYIEHQIQSGNWPRGFRVPAVRQMSADLGIAYATVARAVRELVTTGLLEAQSGRGTHVAAQRKRRLRSIGILGFVSYQSLLHTTRYYRQLLLRLQEQIIDQGQTVVYGHWAHDQALNGMFDDLRLVDGLLLLGVDEGRLEEVRRVKRLGTPIVCMGDTVSSISNMSAVHGANEQDSQRAIEYLISQGHRHIACCMVSSKPPHAGIQGRLLGYERAMENSPAGYDRHYQVRGTAEEMARKLLALKPAPTALFMPESLGEIISLHERLRGSHMELGKHVFPCLYDENLWDNVSGMGIGYMSIEQPLSQIASIALEGLMRMIDEPGFVAPHVEVPSKIILVGQDSSRRSI